MVLSRLRMSIVGLLVLVATDTTAAPTTATSDTSSAVKKRPKAKSTCPTPDADQCVAPGYIDSYCGRKHVDVCKTPLQDAMKAWHDSSSAPKVKMLRPKKTQIPQHVTQGKYFAYKKKAKVKKKGAPPEMRRAYEKTNDVLLGMSGKNMSKQPPVDRVTTVDPNTAAQFHREPAWKENGRAVRSCREYAYARSYDVTRFIDAASACQGDRECVFDVAYMKGSPGIANRKLKNEDGMLIAQLDLAKGVFQKNDFFTPGMDEFVRSNGNAPLEPTAQTNALEAALRDGATFYDIGRCKKAECNGTRKFEDVWDWHETLHDATTAVSQAEAEEYERRRAELRALLDLHAAAVAKEAEMLNQREGRPLVLPLEMRAYDPFERYLLEREFIERGRMEVQRIQRRFGPSILRKNLDEAVQQVKAGASRPAVGVLAAPMKRAKAGKKATKAAKSTTAGGVTKVDKGGVTSDPCLRSSGWGLEMGLRGPISCRIGKFLRNEWARKAAGQRSCLDLGNKACDWMPQMFEAGILEQIPKLETQVADEAYCKAYDDSNTFVDKPAEGIVATVTEVKKRLDRNKARIEKELKTVSDYIRGNGSEGLRLGKDWEGGDYTGDPDWFAAGYDYELGWQVEPAQKSSNGNVCALSGSAHAKMAFDAWIVGNKASVVDGSVWAEAKPGLQGDGRISAHLSMFGQSVFNSHGWKLAQTFGDDPAFDMGVVLPKPKPRFDVYVGVPISGQVWGELLFGSTLDVSAKSPTGCNDSQPFSIVATYAPFFGAFGTGKIGVGIAGVASAGIRASLTLVMMSLPVEFAMRKSTHEGLPAIAFDSTIALALNTLSGRVSAYIEFLMVDEEFELFRWKGFKADTPLMPKLQTKVTLAALEPR